MLQRIRDRFTGVIALVIVVAIGLAMTITLVDLDMFTGGGNFAARVNGEEIPLTDFRQVAQRQLLAQEEQRRGELTTAERQLVEREVLEGLVRNRVVSQYIRDIGYRVSDARVAEHIRGLSVFQVGGEFSSDGYRAALASQGVSPTVFEEERRTAMQIEELQNGLLESSFFTPAEFRRFVVLEGERRRAVFALLDPAGKQPGLEIAEADIRAYYEANPGRFETEESVALDYIEARLADLPLTAKINDEELRAVYDAEPERFRSAEQRRARHILIAIGDDTDEAAARKLATDLRARLAAGEDFAALARQFSDDPGSAASGGELAWAAQGTYVAPFESVLFAQQIHDLSEPVRTEFGFHLIELLEIRPGATKSFAEVQGELADELRRRKQQEAFLALTEKLDDAALDSPGSLDPVAGATGLPVRHIEHFTRAGGGPFSGRRPVIDAAFSAQVLEDKENSAVIEIEDGVAVVLRVAEHRPARLRALDEVRAEVERTVREQRAAQLTADRGRAIIDAARGGADLVALLAGDKVTLTSPAVPLARNSGEVPAELLAAIFRAPRPAQDKVIVDGLVLADGRFGIFRLDEVIPGKPEDLSQEQRDARKNILARQAGIAEVAALVMALRDKARVVVAPGLFEQADTL